jgi:hypothetical protein
LRCVAKVLGAVFAAGAVTVGLGSAVHALPAPAPPRSQPAGGSPAPAASGATLPFGSSILFVIDDAVNSGTTAPGTTIHMHLRAPLVVNGVTLAPAGTPASFSVVSTRKAQSGDVDGAVQIYVNPLPLPGRSYSLPLRAIHEYLTREVSAGMQATRATTDTVSDIFIPYVQVYQVLRKGHQMVMPVGTVLRAETAATIDASNPANVVLATPPPFVSNYDSPHSDLTPAPIYTPAKAPPSPLHKGRPTLPPRSPSPAAASPAASGSPSGAMPGASASPSAATSPSTQSSPSAPSSPPASASPGTSAPPQAATAVPLPAPRPTATRPSVSASPTAVPY